MCKYLGAESYSSTNARDIAAIAFIKYKLEAKKYLTITLHYPNQTPKHLSQVAEMVVGNSFRP